MLTLLFEVTNVNLLLGFMPESIGLLLFGVALVVFAVSLRRVFNRRDEAGREFQGITGKD